MTGSTIIFYLLAAVTLVNGLLAVTSRHIFRSAIYLLFSLIGIAGIYFWLNYQFIAAVQIVVYVGGIVVLIIFSIFLTQQAGEKLPKQKLNRKIFSALAAFCGFALTIVQLYQSKFYSISQGQAGSPRHYLDPGLTEPSVSNIGKQMLNVNDTGYALPFEVISILLLAAMVGCIVIALRGPKTTEQKIQTIST